MLIQFNKLGKIKMFKKIVLVLLLVLPLFSCPFDEDDNDPTVDSYASIEKAINNDDYKSAMATVVKWKDLYQYFEDTYKEPVNTKLKQSVSQKDKKQTIFWLNRSMVIETKELITKAQESIANYKQARIYLIKAKNHLKVINKKLDKKDAIQNKKDLRKLLKTLGNPGMFGVGKKDKDSKMFVKYKDKIFSLLDSNFSILQNIKS